MNDQELNNAWKSLEGSEKKLFIATVWSDGFGDSFFFGFRNKIIRSLKPATISTINLEFNSKHIKQLINSTKEDDISHTVHSAMLEELRQIIPSNSLVLILDLDAFPLSQEALKLTFVLANKLKVSGNAQRTNCIDNGEHIFVGPSYMCIDSDFLKSLASPWVVNRRSDVGEEISWELGSLIKKSLFLPFKTIKPPIWPLGGTKKVYGIGTYFSYDETPISYHHFFSRNFIGKLHFWFISFITYLFLILNEYSSFRLRKLNPIVTLKRIARFLRSTWMYLINKPF